MANYSSKSGVDAKTPRSLKQLKAAKGKILGNFSVAIHPKKPGEALLGISLNRLDASGQKTRAMTAVDKRAEFGLPSAVGLARGLVAGKEDGKVTFYILHSKGVSKSMLRKSLDHIGSTYADMPAKGGMLVVDDKQEKDIIQQCQKLADKTSVQVDYSGLEADEIKDLDDCLNMQPSVASQLDQLSGGNFLKESSFREDYRQMMHQALETIQDSVGDERKEAMENFARLAEVGPDPNRHGSLPIDLKNLIKTATEDDRALLREQLTEMFRPAPQQPIEPPPVEAPPPPQSRGHAPRAIAALIEEWERELNQDEDIGNVLIPADDIGYARGMVESLRAAIRERKAAAPEAPEIARGETFLKQAERCLLRSSARSNLTDEQKEALRQERQEKRQTAMQQELVRAEEWNQKVQTALQSSSFTEGDPLGKGAAGSVQLLQLPDNDLKVAFKTSINVDNPTELDRFLRNESQVYQDVGPHPNIARFGGVAEIGGKKGIIIQGIGGGSVDNFLEKGLSRLLADPGSDDEAPLSAAEYWSACQHLLRGAIEGLRHLSEMGYHHQDIKGENMMIDPETLETRLIDFGLSSKPEQNRPNTDPQALQRMTRAAAKGTEAWKNRLTDELPAIKALKKHIQTMQEDSEDIKIGAFTKFLQALNNQENPPSFDQLLEMPFLSESILPEEETHTALQKIMSLDDLPHHPVEDDNDEDDEDQDGDEDDDSSSSDDDSDDSDESDDDDEDDDSDEVPESHPEELKQNVLKSGEVLDRLIREMRKAPGPTKQEAQQIGLALEREAKSVHLYQVQHRRQQEPDQDTGERLSALVQRLTDMQKAFDRLERRIQMQEGDDDELDDKEKDQLVKLRLQDDQLQRNDHNKELIKDLQDGKLKASEVLKKSILSTEDAPSQVDDAEWDDDDDETDNDTLEELQGVEESIRRLEAEVQNFKPGRLKKLTDRMIIQEKAIRSALEQETDNLEIIQLRAELDRRYQALMHELGKKTDITKIVW